MAEGSNLTDEELQQLYDLFTAFQASGEFQEVAGEPEDQEVMDGALTLINYARNNRPQQGD